MATNVIKLSESDREAMRKTVTKNVSTVIRSNPSHRVARFVDAQVLDKTVLHQYGRWKQNMTRAGVPDNIEKARSTYGNAFFGDKFRTAEVPLNLPIEEAYLDIMGKGFDGSEHPTALHQSFNCPHCHLLMKMDPGVMDLHCPRCGHLTQLGQLVIEEKAYKRW